MANHLGLALLRATHQRAALVAGSLGAPIAQRQQAAALRAGRRQRAIPDGKVAGWEVGAAVEELAGLTPLALHQLAAALRAGRARLRHEWLLEVALRIAGA